MLGGGVFPMLGDSYRVGHIESVHELEVFQNEVAVVEESDGGVDRIRMLGDPCADAPIRSGMREELGSLVVEDIRGELEGVADRPLPIDLQCGHDIADALHRIEKSHEIARVAREGFFVHGDPYHRMELILEAFGSYPREYGLQDEVFFGGMCRSGRRLWRILEIVECIPLAELSEVMVEPNLSHEDCFVTRPALICGEAIGELARDAGVRCDVPVGSEGLSWQAKLPPAEARGSFGHEDIIEPFVVELIRREVHRLLGEKKPGDIVVRHEDAQGNEE